MRQIKFRAWRTDDKYMVTTPRGVLTAIQHNMRLAFNAGFSNTDNQPHCDRYILMQFTGLYDKNGKEIYEGDIVRLKDYHGERIVSILFHNGVYYYGGDGFSDEYIFNSSDREVIGNIHEHPELLEP